MPPKRRAAASSASPPPKPSSSSKPETRTVTILPPATSSTRKSISKTPSILRFPLILLLSFSLSAVSHTVYHALSGTRLDVVSPDGNPQWQVLATAGWRTLELAVYWFGDFDAHDTLSLTLITRLPHLHLLNVYYNVNWLPLYALLLTNAISTVLPIYLLRPLSALHMSLASPPSQDNAISIITTALSTLTYSLPYVALSLSGVLPAFLATHFDRLKSLTFAHESNLPQTAALLFPLGLAATRYFLPAAASPFSSAQPTTYVIERDFDPVTASLSQTLHRNVLWHLYLPARAQEVMRRVFVAVIMTFLSEAFWAWMEIDGVEAIGAVGWAGVWSVGAAATGLILGWCGGLTDA